MKAFFLFSVTLFCLNACRQPDYFVQKGNYDKAIDLYGERLRSQGKSRQKSKDLKGLESSFELAQNRDLLALEQLQIFRTADQWPGINALHRQIQARQNKLSALQPLRSRSGYAPNYKLLDNIDSLQKDSRLQAARYLYAHAQRLLAITDSTGQRAPAREAYYALRDLKSNYFPYWENANALIDSAYRVGKAHVVIETSTAKGISDGNTFWEYFTVKPNFVRNEWLVFYPDSSTRKSFDYRVKCQLVALYVGSESNSSTERTESKQVEDGYDETLDTAGHVIARTARFKTETTTITTYASSRSADGSVLFELLDEHTGAVLSSKALQGYHNFSETSETSPPSAPSYWGMIGHVASDIEWDVREELRRALVKR
jgi:hypothetical protein